MARINSNGRNGRGRDQTGGVLRAALYLRMSSDQQTESIPQQRQALIEYAAKHGYKIVSEFEDSGISGDQTERRVGFLEMRAAAGRNEFDLVLAWDADRIGRFDILDAGYWLRPFRQAGIVFETVAGGRVDLEGLNGQLLYSVNQLAKHQYLIDLSRNVSRGQLAAARSDKRHGCGGGGPTLLGYHTTDTGTVEVIPDEAEIVKRIFREYLDPSGSLRSVANSLNRDGIETSRGKKWTQGGVRRVLTNQKYLGCFVRFRIRSGKYHAIDDDGQIVPRSKADRAVEVDPLIVVPGNHVAIIDQETFDRTQDKLARQQTQTAPRTGHQYALTGLVVCADCGCKMLGRPTPRTKEDGTVRRGYLCGSYLRGGKSACHCNSVYEDRLLECVVRKIRREYCSAERIEDLRTAFRRELRDQGKQTDRQADQQRRLRKQIEVLDQQLDQAAERVLVAPAAVVSRLSAKLGEMQAERDRLQAELDAVAAYQQQPETLDETTVEAAISELETLSEGLRTDADPEFRRQWLDRMVVKIKLEFTHRQVGRQTRSTITGGSILLRADLALSSLLSRISRKTE